MNAHDMVVNIAEINPVLGLDRLVGVSCQSVEHLALGVEDLLEADGQALEAENRLNGPGRGSAITWFCMVSMRSSRCSMVSERLVHGPLQKADEQMICALLKPVARVAFDRLAILVQE